MGKISNDPDAVAAQYATSDRLSTRASVWQDTPDGRNPRRAALAAVAAADPAAYLEIGCGTGDFALSVQEALPTAHVIATDASQAMALETAGKGVLAQVARADDLPFDDASFDVVYAGWMLYHVPDLDAAIGEVRRVLRPGGTFVAATNGAEHMADLMGEAGGEPLITQFSTENGQEVLSRQFTVIEQEDFDTRARFADHASAQAYLNTFSAELAAQLPSFEGEREYRGSSSVFVAR
ncbi:class I SAM-dependent methyltransferase [Yimella sp. cx-51]|uniref:class I SAM-dependent methyltransferase n=1 Tax=Yimella sp. cx-51 TaxID=2770551 RepID=UPI00165D5734|nr:class I SAM-dependent methyltransferase [Yimella sp. cx-51]MBC9956610.1 methyltransferase domain-containing protein [Yimella sp. cx-51]QTH38291.1 methyltransferase domain-containing protein [Yimella sp. cx-51]